MDRLYVEVEVTHLHRGRYTTAWEHDLRILGFTDYMNLYTCGKIRHPL